MDRLGTDSAPTHVAPPQAHLVDLSQRGMSGLAQLLLLRGYAVSGSVPDQETSPSPATEHLRRLGVRVHQGHTPLPVWKSARWLVHGPGVPREHPERLTALREGVHQRSYPEILTDLFLESRGIAVAGDRRAGVAAAMIGWTLLQGGSDPSVVLGASSPQLGGWARLGSDDWLVVEMELPILLARTGGAERQVLIAGGLDTRAEEVLAMTCGHALLWSDDPRGIPAESEGREWLSLHDPAQWWAADLRADRGKWRFRAFHRGQFVAEIRLQVPGRRNIDSALAAVATCASLGLPSRVIKDALEEFSGVARGFECRGSFRGVTLLDDDAHGADEVEETLRSARDTYGARRLWAVLRPEGAESGENGLAEALATADNVLFIDGASTDGPLPKLHRNLSDVGVEVGWAPGVSEAVERLDQRLRPGDVLVTLGRSDLGTIADAFLRRLSRDRHDR